MLKKFTVGKVTSGIFSSTNATITLNLETYLVVSKNLVILKKNVLFSPDVV